MGLSSTMVVIFMVALFQGFSFGLLLESTNGERLLGKNYITQRKLLLMSKSTPTGDYDGAGGGSGAMNRIGSTCSRDNIVLNQGPTAPLPSGIPTYTVIVENVCLSGCSISNIHFSCEFFASARTINPHIFRRITPGDCLLNDGNPIMAGDSIVFQYANTFPYPLAVSQLTCL